MRLVTNSPFSSKGLISIIEAEENAAQNVIFCVPIEAYEAGEIYDLHDFKRSFRKGITTKIKDSNLTETISLDFHSESMFGSDKKYNLPKFTATVKGQNIDFYLSSLNFLNYNVQSRLSFEYYYDGRIFPKLIGKRLVILEPNWKQLDQLFIEEGILFSDWE